MSTAILVALALWQIWRWSRVVEPTVPDKLAMAYIALGCMRLAAKAVGS